MIQVARISPPAQVALHLLMEIREVNPLFIGQPPYRVLEFAVAYRI
jgi:hypothetical protein